MSNCIRFGWFSYADLRHLHFVMKFSNTEEEEEESRNVFWESLTEILMNGFELQKTSLTTLVIETRGYDEDEEEATMNLPVNTHYY